MAQSGKDAVVLLRSIYVFLIFMNGIGIFSLSEPLCVDNLQYGASVIQMLCTLYTARLSKNMMRVCEYWYKVYVRVCDGLFCHISTCCTGMNW